MALFLAPLVFLYLDDTKIFDVLPQLGGEPVGYLGSCGYRNIEVVSLTVNGENRVYLDANDLYNDHLGTLLVNFNGVTNDTGTLQCKDLMLYVEEIEGRQLPNNADEYCSGRRGTIVVDNTHSEQFKYSCCHSVSHNCTHEIANTNACCRQSSGTRPTRPCWVYAPSQFISRAYSPKRRGSYRT